MRHQNRNLTFEDLRGLRAEGYIRDSTLDQRDGFGPDIQSHNLQRFAEVYGLILGDKWYTEFISGRYAKKRAVFQQFIEDAYQDAYDVLLVDHTSRFGRNQEECIRFKSELRKLGKIIVFVAQGIISGSDRDFVNERINETLDEQSSRNLSYYVTEGMANKASQGLANGVPPLGYKSEKLENGKRERLTSGHELGQNFL
jgi:DNA invertase Pin-like site-specific DNA recombinase